MLIYAVGDPVKRSTPYEGGRISAERAKVLVFLLADGPRVQAPYRKIASEVGVSLGLVSQVMARLMRQGMVTRRAQGPTRSVPPTQCRRDADRAAATSLGEPLP